MTSLETLPRTCGVINQGIAQHLHYGVQVYVSQNFSPLADVAIGDNVPGQPLTREMLMPWLSAGKPLTAAAVMLFVQAGELELERPVADVIPEFAQAGKGQITLRDLLTHTAGLKPLATGWPHLGWDAILTRINTAPLRRDWGPQTRVGYDPARTWFVLGEMLQRVDGRPVDRIVREELLEPLGMTDSWMAIPSHLQERYGHRLGISYAAKDGQLVPTPADQSHAGSVPSPGASMRGPVRELAIFYEMLLREGAAADGRQLLQPATVAHMTRRQRAGLYDVTFQHQVDFGLGLIINSARYGADTVPYGFGPYAADDTFGHGGAQSAIGFADPRTSVVVTAVANGRPGEELHHDRFRRLITAIYEDLDLAHRT